MISHFEKLLSVFVAVLLITIASPELANAAAVLADLENALMCKCDDKCGKVLINCTCSTADKNRKKFAKMLESGLTVDQIVQQQIEKYGETVLSAPTKNGFNLTAWVVPFGALIFGGLGLRRLLSGWVAKNTNTRSSDKIIDVASGGNPSNSRNMASNQYSRRLQEELNQLET
jgi:cytochrome c-type biogenesis protein CcmH